MNRMELEGLDRDALIARAESAGVTRAAILTRSELVDELLVRSATDEATKARTRGFFGRARDLVARAVERGLHLPDAAERIRALGILTPQKRAAPVALPTVTLAEIYAAQGHRDRAIDTLQGVLSHEPDHAAARTLLSQLLDTSYPMPAPRMAPEHESVWPAESDGEGIPEMPSSPGAEAAATDPKCRGVPPSAAACEPAHVLDDAPLPTRYDVDECVAIPVDPRTLYVYWEVRERTLQPMGIARPHGTIALRVLIVEPNWEGPRSSVRDHEVGMTLGDFFVRDLPLGCVVRTAIGWKYGDAFLPIAHSPALETPPGAPSPLVADVLVRWTPSGILPVARDDRDAAAIDRALGRVRLQAARDGEDGEPIAANQTARARVRSVNAPSS